MNLSIRHATAKDAGLIADLSRQTFYDSFAQQCSKEDMELFLQLQFTKGRLMLEVGSSENIFLLAYNEDEVAGYAKLRDAKHPPALGTGNALEIARLYAATHMIGKGVGKRLMEASLQIAKEQQKEVIWLGVWENNFRAIDFYTGWGFEKFDECDFILGNDLQRDWLMKKQL